MSGVWRAVSEHKPYDTTEIVPPTPESFTGAPLILMRTAETTQTRRTDEEHSKTRPLVVARRRLWLGVLGGGWNRFGGLLGCSASEWRCE